MMTLRGVVALACFVFAHMSHASRFLDLPRELVMDVNKGCVRGACFGHFTILVSCRPFPIVNVVADQVNVAPAESAALQSARSAERERSRASAQSLQQQQQQLDEVIGGQTELLDRLARQAAAGNAQLSLA